MFAMAPTLPAGTASETPKVAARRLSSSRPPISTKSSAATAVLTKKLAMKVVIGLSGRPALATMPLVIPP